MKYALEVISSGSDKNVKRLEGMQSKAARFILNIPRKEWSRTLGYQELGWLTIPQTAIQFSLKLFFKVLWLRIPVNLYKLIYDEEKEEIRQVTEEDLRNMTKLNR